MHLPFVYSTFHLEHHVPVNPTALIGTAGTGFWESVARSGGSFGLRKATAVNAAGTSAAAVAQRVLFLMEHTQDEVGHHYYDRSETILPHVPIAMVEAVWSIWGMLCSAPYLLLSKALGRYAELLAPRLKAVLGDLEVKNWHGLHHWTTADVWGVGLIDQYVSAALAKRAVADAKTVLANGKKAAT